MYKNKEPTLFSKSLINLARSIYSSPWKQNFCLKMKASPLKLPKLLIYYNLNYEHQYQNPLAIWYYRRGEGTHSENMISCNELVLLLEYNVCGWRKGRGWLSSVLANQINKLHHQKDKTCMDIIQRPIAHQAETLL